MENSKKELCFVKAQAEQAHEILALYQSVLHTEFCVWNEYYPSMSEIDADIKTGNLYLLMEETKIVGAISVVPENEMDDRPQWTVQQGAREIARVVVALGERGRGLAAFMVGQVEAILQNTGCPSIHLSVAKGNPPAQKTYLKCGFSVVGEAEMYGNAYWLMEKQLLCGEKTEYLQSGM